MGEGAQCVRQMTAVFLQGKWLEGTPRGGGGASALSVMFQIVTGSLIRAVRGTTKKNFKTPRDFRNWDHEGGGVPSTEFSKWSESHILRKN